MTWERSWALLLVLLPLVWMAWQWRRTGRKAGLVLKGLAAVAVAVALAEPVMSVWETKMAVAVLVDTSASVSEADLARSSEIVTGIERARGRHLVRVMPFAAGVRAPHAEEQGSDWKFQQTAGEEGRASNLEAAILDAAAAMPAGLIPRIVLISDGRQNRGSASRAAWQARELDIAIDTYPMAGRPEPELKLGAAGFPTLTWAGERFPIELTVQSPGKASGTVTVSAEGRPLGESPVELEQGANHLTVHASLNLAGAFDIAGSLRTNEYGEARFAQAVAVRLPKILFVSLDPKGTEEHLLASLRAGNFQITETDAIPKEGLDQSQIVILNNWDMEAVPERQKEEVESFVQAGGGLLVIGGERNRYVEDPLKVEDPLERALPAKLAPPRSPEATCVVLIVDKSSSMEGRKMELARLSAIGVIDNLRPEDWVGVLIFDNSFQWAVPIRKAENRSLIKRLIAGITPDGGTQIAPALQEAYQRVLPIEATFKHIVLLTDGISEEGDSVTLAQEAATRKVTISTVGLGQDVNKSYLERVALFAKGKAYFLTDPSSLAQILLRDVMEHTGQTAVEKAVSPIVERKAEILAGLEDAEFPALKGYVRYESKPDAETILRFDPKDPLLVRWQYGLGRAAVFTSDAKSRWAEAWIGWSGFDTFWINLMRDLLPHAAPGDAQVAYDPANRELVVDYRLARRLKDPPSIPDIFVVGPGGFRKPLEVRKVADGAYRGIAPVDGAQGLFRVRALDESGAFPETGVYLQEQELSDFGSNEELLRNLASFTGGRFQPAPEDVFDSEGRAVQSTMVLWPILLLLAIVLNLAELVLRKWRAIFARR